MTMRAKIDRLEAEIYKRPQVEIPVRHYFPSGLYAREIVIPAGIVLTGKIHRGEHLNIVSAGCIDVLTDDGMQRVTAPFTMVSRAGTKRVGYAHSETVWTTIHGNPDNETDLEILEARYIVPTFAELTGPEARALIEGV